MRSFLPPLGQPMLREVSQELFFKRFPDAPHFFISADFLATVAHKATRLRFWVSSDESVRLGLMVDECEGKWRSPFSAPFGGFHYPHERLSVTEITSFFNALAVTLIHEKITYFSLILPPDIYQTAMNAKCVNVALRSGFTLALPEPTSWIEVHNFTGSFAAKASREAHRKAERVGWHFVQAITAEQKAVAYDIITENRQRQGRSIFMSLHEVLAMESVVPVDCFLVTNQEGETGAAAFCYRFEKQNSAFALFWGDTVAGRQESAMDFLVYHLFTYYKNLGYMMLDLGISTEERIPNSSLLSFKENHSAHTGLRHTLLWEPHDA